MTPRMALQGWHRVCRSVRRLLLGAVFGVCVTVAFANPPVGWGATLSVTNAVVPIVEQAQIIGISCDAPGNCGAVGTYLSGAGPGTPSGLVMSESGGVWGPAEAVTLPGDARPPDEQDVQLGGISCPGAGDCTAVGTYVTEDDQTEAWLDTETAGVWRPATEGVLPADTATDTNTNDGDSGLVLDAVSCSSPGNCVAVGDFDTADTWQQGLVLTETDGQWALGTEGLLPVGASATRPVVNLTSVSCTGTGDCVAVGNYTDASGNDQGLVLTESNGTWSAAEAGWPASSGANPGVWLTSVSCWATGDCATVGGYYDPTTATAPEDAVPLVMVESDGTWAGAISPAVPADADAAGLTAVSCAPDGSCAAIGNYETRTSSPTIGGMPGALLLSGSGDVWSPATELAPPANAGPGAGPVLTSVSCAGSGDCYAVGQYDDAIGFQQPMSVDQTNGVWGPAMTATMPADQSPSPAGELRSVSCVAGGGCEAGGSYGGAAGEQPLALNEANQEWGTGQDIAVPSGTGITGATSLSSVSCATAGNCEAIGTVSYDGKASTAQTMLNEVDGQWGSGTDPLPTPNGGSVDALNDVSCGGVGDCAAVGQEQTVGGVTHAYLVDDSGGTRQSGIAIQLPDNADTSTTGETVADSELTSVSCSSPGNCTAVGDYLDSGGGQQGLFVTETNGQWTQGVEAQMPSDAASDPDAELLSVSCSAPGYCAAIGNYYEKTPGDLENGVVLTETAGAWSPGTDAPDPSGQADWDLLADVSCSGVGDCVAVGERAAQATISTESAGAWSAVQASLPQNAQSPTPTGEPEQSSGLVSVSCPAAGTCAAVGTYTDDTGQQRGFLLNQTAGAWMPAVEAVTPDSDFSLTLTSVSCGASGYCAAVGQYGQPPLNDEYGGPYGAPLVVTESAGVWTTDSTDAPSTDEQPGDMPAVSCAAQYDCSAVGGTGSAGLLVDVDLAPSQPSQTTTTSANEPGSGDTPATIHHPVELAAPRVTGPAKVGERLQASVGSWSGSGSISYAYWWQRCTRVCVDIRDANAAHYTLTAQDAGASVRVLVAATDATGVSTANSVRTAVVQPSVAQITALIRKASVPVAKFSKVPALLRAHGYSLEVTFPVAATLGIRYVLSGPGKRTTTVAEGQRRLVAGRRSTFSVRLTAAGIRALRGAKRLTVTVDGWLTPAAGSRIDARRRLTLAAG
jgi:hypothetical protein